GETHHHDRSAHAEGLGFGFPAGRAVRFRGFHPPGGPSNGGASQEPRINPVNGQGRGDLGGGVAAHAVRDDGERVVSEDRVLVRLANQSNVGGRGVTPSRQRTTSNKTPPTCTMSP